LEAFFFLEQFILALPYFPSWPNSLAIPTF